MRQAGRPETVGQLMLVQSAAVELEGARQVCQRQRFWDSESDDDDDAEVMLVRRRRESTSRRNILEKVAEKEEARRIFN